VVLIEYFGFPCDERLIERIQARGGVVMIDAAQSLLTDHTATRAEMIVYSPRKFVGVPDGGILELHTHAELSTTQSLGAPPSDWLALATQAAIGRREFDRHGGDREWFVQFQRAEATQPVGDYAMSELSRDLLGRLNYAEIIRRRRENYEVLLDELRALAIFSQLPAGIAPLGFPLRLVERERVRQALFAEQIYPPVHWPLAEVVPPEFVASHHLAREELTLPCDQRYTAADMLHMARIVQREARP
jgi:dTDP-4-amino-4,6-dideoxygalactose transaminase